MIEQDMSFMEDLERGHCVYTLAYKDGSRTKSSSRGIRLIDAIVVVTLRVT
jgi:hypothetical protein